MVNATLEMSSPPAVVSVKKFCPVPLQGKCEVELHPELIERADVCSPISGGIKIEDGLVEEEARNGRYQIIEDAVRHRLDARLP